MSSGHNGVMPNGHNGVLPNGHDEIMTSQAEPLAVVGMTMRLPGGVNSGASFWDFIVNKKDGRCRIPSNRYNVDAFYSPKITAGTVASEYGYFLDDSNLRSLDTSFFSMSQGEVEAMDPQQKIFLEVSW